MSEPTSPTIPPLVAIRDLHISYAAGAARKEVVHAVSFDIAPGEVVALVGESGSGKSTIAQALIGMLPEGGRVDSGTVTFAEREVQGLSEREWRQIRGDQVGWVPQDPMSSLNPVMRVGNQVVESRIIHGGLDRGEATSLAVDLLRRAGLTTPEIRALQYPHELSGGMRQRALIAAATACRPRLLIADEPTSALDVTVQKQILDELARLVRDSGMAMLLVTHDLAVAAERADRVLVLSAGELVEEGQAAVVLSSPHHAYTRALVAAVPGNRSVVRDSTPSSVDPPAAPILVVENLRKEFASPARGREALVAVDDVSFSLERGRTLGLVGESGSGKSTVARIVLRLETETSGAVRFDGADVTRLRPAELRRLRRSMQVVHQNPFTSLEPRYTIEQIVAEPLRAFAVGDSRRRAAEVRSLLDQVSLPATVLKRRPRELSGGQRQRVAIARALVLRPDLLVCDEPTSALDVSVQAQIIELLREIQNESGIAMLFISHDLAVVKDIADHVAVMRRGLLVEMGPVAEVFNTPKNEYTRDLLAAIPGASSRMRGAA